MTARRAAFLAALVGASLAFSAQTFGTAQVRGRVVDAVTKQPIRGAVVSAGTGSRPSPFLTGADGRFTFADLSAGTVNVTASKTGYFAASYGVRRPNGTGDRLVLLPNEIANIELSMWPGASISGTVTDEQGDPIQGVRISTRHPGDMEMRREAIQTRSDGRYSLGDLLPGDYIVGVILDYRFDPEWALNKKGSSFQPTTSSSRDGAGPISVGDGFVAPVMLLRGRKVAQAGAFYVNSSDLSLATPVRLAAGEDRLGVDLRLPLRPAARVSGVVRIPAGERHGVSLMLISDGVTVSTRSLKDGTFVFPSVPSGHYVLHARRPVDPFAAESVGGGLYSTRLPVTIGDTDITDLEVALGIGAVVRGTLNGPSSIELENVRLKLENTEGATTGVWIPGAPGVLEIGGVEAGKYYVRPDAIPGGITLESVQLGGRVITDVPLELEAADLNGLQVTLTDRPASMTGTVVAGDGQPSGIGSVVLFPADPLTWVGSRPRKSYQFKMMRAVQGQFALNEISPGDYYVAAVDDALLTGWPSKDLLTQLTQRASRIKIRPGERVERRFVLEGK